MATPNIPSPPDWIFQRIIAVGREAGPRYEASLYGPTTCLLVSYFPVTDFFMVKPQGKIRPEFINDIDDGARTSLDSYRAEVLPRGFGGSESGVMIPDFIVVKATASKDNDRVLMVVEIKSSDRSLTDSLEQLINYLEALSQKFNSETGKPLFDTLYGLLIIGEKVQLVTFPISGQIGTSGLLDINSPPVHAFLKKIAAIGMTPTTIPPPDWVFQRIIAVGGETGPRYEASLYGPTTCLLISNFPLTRHFMIKPQGKIRPEFINDIDDGARTSLDSYRAEVLPRGFQGSDSGVKIPDFIVVKATASKDNDRVLMVVEIKSSDRSLADSLEQLIDYLEAFTQKIDSETGEPLFDVLYGLLIVGKMVQLVTFPIDGQIGTSRLLDINSAPVQAFLNEIATQNW